MSRETDLYRDEVLKKLAKGKPFARLSQVTYDIDGNKFHIKAKTGHSDDYPFNINNKVLEADYEVYVCGNSDLFYAIPIDIIKKMHSDADAMPDNRHPGYTIVHVRPNEDKIKYAAPSKSVNIKLYKNCTYHDLIKHSPIYKKYGQAGESLDHKRLKEWVAKHPEFVKAINVQNVEIESHRFPSNDLPDIVFCCEDEYCAVEIETDNPLPGAYQAIKYRALLCAELDISPEKVSAVLVAWEIPKSVDDFCKRNNVSFFQKKL